MTDPIHDWTAALDQATAGLSDFVGVLWAYFNDLKKAGFSDHQALAIAIGYQTTMLSTALGAPGGES